MRCKKHTADFSSTVGVCSSCLRERLLAIIAAQAEEQQKPQLSRVQSRAAVTDDHPRKSDTALPPPLVFPRSVSPYVARRKSDDSTWKHNHGQDRRFYSTPQVGPTYAANTFGNGESWRKKNGRFSLLTRLFRSRSEKIESDPRVSNQESCEPSSSATISSSSSPWFTTIFSGSRRKNSRLFVLEEATAAENRKPRPRADRGMSPARTADSDNECDRSPSASGYASETWRSPAFSVRRTRPGHSRNMSGIAFCLSPLVRASPSRHWSQKGLPTDMAVSGEPRVPRKPHLPTAAPFSKNRSRKLADFGRVHYNR